MTTATNVTAINVAATRRGITRETIAELFNTARRAQRLGMYNIVKESMEDAQRIHEEFGAVPAFRMNDTQIQKAKEMLEAANRVLEAGTTEEKAKAEIVNLVKARPSRNLVTVCQIVAELHPEDLTVDEVFHLCLDLRSESKLSFNMAADGELTVY